jgi:prepilin-type N-terminal cleavage/methylation domain-containing protein
VKSSFLRKQRGFTLVEILIAVVVGSLAVVGIYRLFSASLRSYSLQDQVAGMYQNGTYSIKKISELLMQAGVDLPPKNYTVLFAQSSRPDSFCIKVNPNGARYTFTSNLINSDSIPITNAASFAGCDSLLKDSLDTSFTVYQIQSVDTASAMDTIHLKIGSHATFYAGTTIYGFKTVSYSFKARTIYCNSDTLADNIDSMAIVYYDKNHAATTSWTQMVTANIYIRSRSAKLDLRYKCPGFNDGYRRVPMSTEVRFRNRF